LNYFADATGWHRLDHRRNTAANPGNRGLGEAHSTAIAYAWRK
jgi:hypothetical protein